MSTPPKLFDRDLLRRRLDRAAAGYAQADFLKARAAQDAAWRLEPIMRRFPLAVDLGARGGAFRRAVAQSDAADKIDLLIETEITASMLGPVGARLVADEERLPFADSSLDLIVSTLALHWTNDLVGSLIQARRALKPDGLFIGSFLGGATLTELRQALLEAESELSGGAAMRVSPFADHSDAAGLLSRAGFALPVADVDRVTVRYAHPIELLRDLRRMGETSVLSDRPRKPMTRALLGRALQIYVERFAEPDGRVPATFEILTITGWVPHESQQKPLARGSAQVGLEEALSVVRKNRGDA
ncbi:methyltransferase domain-containing protein [Caulobacter sp. 73W]|uniref:Methyltransferase domain-containing protein n=1 Tax=Caulobacter sp. 73W TaxID=3161137 RepID=A0AB39KX09_9CAUL